MFSPTRTALCVAICATLGLAATEASAGCKLINGAKFCASWITGSEICQVAVDSNQITNPETATCFVRGFASGDGTEFTPFVCDDSTLTGEQTCGPAPTFTASTTANTNGNGWAGGNPSRQGPKCDHDKKNKNPACVQGTPQLGGDILSSPTVPLKCNGNGICTATAEVEVPPDATCSPGGGALLDFTADSFVGVVEIDTATDTLFFAQLCTLDQNGHSYTCTDPSENVTSSCEFPPD